MLVILLFIKIIKFHFGKYPVMENIKWISYSWVTEKYILLKTLWHMIFFTCKRLN